MRTISNQLVRLAAADAAGQLDDPKLQAQAGPIFDFYVGMVGLAGGTKAYQALTGGTGGTGSISAAAAGKNFILDLFRDMPASARMDAFQLIFTDPVLSANLLRPANTAKEAENQLSRIQKFFLDRGFSVASGQQPYIIREMYEDEDKGTGMTAEDMIGDQTSVQPDVIQPTPLPTPPAAQPTTAMASVTPPPPAAPAPNGPVNRQQYAALFPNDIASGMIRQNQGIGSLMG
jgi:hypothetical protein